ncbi:MAG TPA: hypothetical protein VJ276_02840 [Thermoanaerobaculia bacterium]|nr:hypothetical protein [Thermoanaerobaculia bacterium]
MFAKTRLLAACAVVAGLASTAAARVISYAPYSDRASFPAQQLRLNRHFVLVEGFTIGGQTLISPPLPYGATQGQLVAYDSQGLEEPQVVFPKDGSMTGISAAAARESGSSLVILIQTTADFEGKNPQRLPLFLLSTDAGASWKRVLLPGNNTLFDLINGSADTGGPFARARYSNIRIGTSTYPFVVNLGSEGLWAVGSDGSTKVLVPKSELGPSSQVRLIGTDSTGTRFLYRVDSNFGFVDLNGNRTFLGSLDSNGLQDGWMTNAGDAYIEQRSGNQVSLYFFRNGQNNLLASAPLSTDQLGVFAIPTSDYSGAWIITRGGGQPTVLSKHTASAGMVEQWRDITAPEVEALHAGPSGNTVLIQVHRPRLQPDQRLFKDPALAVWHVGQPAPRAYDELFMNEQVTKGFVHVDADKLEAGEPFVFDSGAIINQGGGGVIISPSVPVGGGGDVIQEWGVVRASLRQQLILPGIGRTPGAYNSNWLSDVIVYNPLDQGQAVSVRYIATGEEPQTQELKERTLNLAPHEIRVIPDALKTLFGIDNGGGAFHIIPDAGVNVTSRTYNKVANGTYGFGMNGIDLYSAASPRFPVSFAGAFNGANFRTNLILTDTSRRGTAASLTAAGQSGSMGNSGVVFAAPSGGQQQKNSIASDLGLFPSDTGALIVKPERGETIASVIAIDNKTNDPTYFPPDLPSPVVRTIPAIGHLDGANNSRFRSDLYLYNPAAQPRQVTLQAKMWDTNEQPMTLNLTLLPNEARVIRDVLFTAFGRSGIARLRYQSQGDPVGVRVTSRTYTIGEDGGTFGFLMPPLNNFQSAGTGDTLEILGVVGGAGYRTNLGIIELTGFPGGQAASVRIEIIDNGGKTIDTFTVTVASAGGIQLNDIFRARGFGDGPTAALIRVTPLSGIIGAYATLNDNGTNDPTYLAANLAAKE